MGPIDLSETPIKNYHSAPRDVLAGRRYNLPNVIFRSKLSEPSYDDPRRFISQLNRAVCGTSLL
jgi:hypothetical protein